MNRKTIFLGMGVLTLLAVAVRPAFTEIGKHRAIATTPRCHTPRAYHDSITSFNKQPVIMGRTIFLGNSITQRANWQELLDDPTAINRGIGGDVTCGVLNRLDDVIKRQPSKLFLLIGINDMQIDLNNGRPANIERILENYELILQRLKAETPASRVYVQSLLPTNVSMRQHRTKSKSAEFSNALNAGVRTLNPRLKQLAASYGCTWVNSYDALRDGNHELAKDYTDDGIHPNRAGYEQLVAYLQSQGFVN